MNVCVVLGDVAGVLGVEVVVYGGGLKFGAATTSMADLRQTAGATSLPYNSWLVGFTLFLARKVRHQGWSDVVVRGSLLTGSCILLLCSKHGLGTSQLPG